MRKEMKETEPLELGKVISGATTKEFQFVTKDGENIAVGQCVVVPDQENKRIIGIISDILTINEYASEGAVRQIVARGDNRTYENKTVFICKCDIICQLDGKKSSIPQLPPIAFKPVYVIEEISLSYRMKAE